MLKITTLFIRIFSLNFLLLLLSIFLFQTCSDDNSPTEPESSPALAEATIGSGGGTLKTDDFELIVPVGAFPIDTKLILSLVENESSRLDNIVSKEFMIEGLPRSFLQPITIKLKYSSELTDSSYIAIGKNVWVSSLNEETISYHLLPAMDSSGFITTQIAPTDGNNSFLGKSTQDKIVTDGVNIYAVSGKDYLSNEKHFKIFYNSSLNESNVKNIAAYLETAYTKFQALGFQYDRRTVWPIEVNLEQGLKTNDGKTTYGLYATVFWSIYNIFNSYNAGYLRLNADFITDTEEMKSTIGHEFFHLVQGLYDTRSIYDKRSGPSKNYWIDEASAVWAEGLFSSDPKYVSGVFATSANMVLYGSNDSGGDYANFYGYGMSSFMKYISVKFGNGVIVKIYNEIFKGHYSFSAIDSAIPKPTSSFWDEFIQQYLTYSIYKLEPQWLTLEAASAGRSFTIKEDTDTVKIYSENFNDLSARIYSVRTVASSLKSIDENSQLVFETEGNMIGNIELFKENKEESVFLKQGENSVTLDNFRSITDAGYVIIAAVTNSRLVAPYKETSSGELVIKVINKEVDTTPVITEIYDRTGFQYNNTTHSFTLPYDDAEIRGWNLGENSKVFINGIESTLQYRMFDDTSGFFQMPELIGNISVKVVSDVGESNEFTYYCGVPLSYLASAESVEIMWRFIVGDYGSKRELFLSPSDEVIVFPKGNLKWSDNKLTVDLSGVPNVDGSIQLTFLNTGDMVNNVQLDYSRRNESPNEVVHYLGENFTISQSRFGGIKYGFNYSNQIINDMLNMNTISLSGTTDTDGDGDVNEFDFLRTGDSDQLLYVYLNFSQ